MAKSNRIFELDAMRGVCILGMIGVHVWMNYCDFFMDSEYPAFLQFFFDWGGIVFVLLSGIALTLGHHPVKRGSIVLGAGILCTLVTLIFNQFFGIIPIWFGILHCLGVCMLLAPLLNKLPTWLLPLIGLLFIGVGLWMENIRVENPYLFPLGLITKEFTSGDYFPLLPNLGWFMAGMAIGHTFYKNKKTLLPQINANLFPIRALCFLGRHTLWIYLIHQPLLFGIFYLIQG
ncbi:MAG: DUF1624 domain-containing protein [Clostridia bacterium]|nr:DUF1624 domain-containing protein [Clostridia bacterium]